jgi:hypothetical protein
VPLDFLPDAKLLADTAILIIGAMFSFYFGTVLLFSKSNFYCMLIADSELS